MLVEKNKWEHKTKLQACFCYWLHGNLHIWSAHLVVWQRNRNCSPLPLTPCQALTRHSQLPETYCHSPLPVIGPRDTAQFHSTEESEFWSTSGHHSTTRIPNSVVLLQSYLLLSRPERISIRPTYLVRNSFNSGTMCAACSTQVFQHSHQAKELE